MFDSAPFGRRPLVRFAQHDKFAYGLFVYWHKKGAVSTRDAVPFRIRYKAEHSDEESPACEKYADKVPACEDKVWDYSAACLLASSILLAAAS